MVGTPVDLTLDELKIEMFFPADEASRQVLVALAGMGPRREVDA